MKPQELLLQIRTKFDLSQAALGELLGVDGRTIRRWEAEPGTVESARHMPEPAIRLARLLADTELSDTIRNQLEKFANGRH